MDSIHAGIQPRAIGPSLAHHFSGFYDHGGHVQRATCAERLVLFHNLYNQSGPVFSDLSNLGLRARAFLTLPVETSGRQVACARQIFSRCHLGIRLKRCGRTDRSRRHLVAPNDCEDWHRTHVSDRSTIVRCFGRCGRCERPRTITGFLTTSRTRLRGQVRHEWRPAGVGDTVCAAKSTRLVSSF